MSDSIDQTRFTEGTHIAMPPVPPKIEVPVKKRSPLLFILIAVLAVIVVLGSITFVKYTTRVAKPTSIPQTPAPSSEPIETQGIRTEIAPFIKTIEDSNPEMDEHPFPPVNFTLRIKDPNIK